MAKASADGKRVDQVLDIIKEMTMLELRDLNDGAQHQTGRRAHPGAWRRHWRIISFR